MNTGSSTLTGITSAPYTWTTTSTSSWGPNYVTWAPSPTTESEIEQRAEEKAKKMVIEELKKQYRVKERGWGNSDGYEFFRNTLVECNGKKAVVVSTGYKGLSITVNGYEAKYDRPLWVADIGRKLGDEIVSASIIDGDINHDKKIAEIINYLRKEDAEDGEV